jgi:glucose 1-dehydrogenase
VDHRPVSGTLTIPDRARQGLHQTRAATLTVGLAKELAAEGVQVNAVTPGVVATGIHAAAGDSDRLERVVPRIPAGRVGQAEEISAAVARFRGSEAGYVTGAVLRVAGGLSVLADHP